jgi:hypothetical protein
VTRAVGWLGISLILQATETKPPWNEANLCLAIEAAGVALWSGNVDSDKLTMDEGGYHLWGVPISEFVTFDIFRPISTQPTAIGEERPLPRLGRFRTPMRSISASFLATKSDGFRPRPGSGGRVMFGIFIDVTGRRTSGGRP